MVVNRTNLWRIDFMQGRRLIYTVQGFISPDAATAYAGLNLKHIHGTPKLDRGRI